MNRLDKSKPYGTIIGPGENYKYSQGGKKFDGVGNEVKEKKTKKPGKKK